METGRTTQLTAVYLMSLYAPLDPPLQIDEGLVIFNVGDGGWVRGPRIRGTITQPSADWLHVLPSGMRRQDVRLTIKTDEGALIYATYNGVLRVTKETGERLARGELLTDKDLYSSTAPTFRTSHQQYAWLNTIQAIARLVELQRGARSHIKFDVFEVR
jgi:hypothetical protein